MKLPLAPVLGENHLLDPAAPEMFTFFEAAAFWLFTH